MSKSNREHLSCLMDGELDHGAQRFLLRRLSEDAEMKTAWRRFHTVRACLHRELLATRDLTSRVAAALDAEPVPGQGGRMAAWFKPVAGGAIAASVALMAIVGINSSVLERQPDAVDQQPGFVSQPTSLDQPFTRSAVPVSYSEGSNAERQRINGHVLRHHQAAGGTGFVSYVPIVTGISDETVRVQARSEDESRQTDR